MGGAFKLRCHFNSAFVPMSVALSFQWNLLEILGEFLSAGFLWNSVPPPGVTECFGKFLGFIDLSLI